MSTNKMIDITEIKEEKKLNRLKPDRKEEEEEKEEAEVGDKEEKKEDEEKKKKKKNKQLGSDEEKEDKNNNHERRHRNRNRNRNRNRHDQHSPRSDAEEHDKFLQHSPNHSPKALHQHNQHRFNANSIHFSRENASFWAKNFQYLFRGSLLPLLHEEDGKELQLELSKWKELHGTTSSKEKRAIPSDTVLQIQIQRADELPKDFRLSSRVVHPMIKVHIVDLRTGKYLKKHTKTKEYVVNHHEKRTKRELDENGHWKTESEVCDFILPSMTSCASFKSGSNSGSMSDYLDSSAPIWNETLIFYEQIKHLITPHTIFLFELLDFDPQRIMSNGKKVYGSSGNHRWFESTNVSSIPTIKRDKQDGFDRIAWAFFRPVNTQGRSMMTFSPLDEAKDIRLQFYEFLKLSHFDREQALREYNWDFDDPTAPFVFLQYQKKMKIPVGTTTLHLSIHPIVPMSSKPLKVLRRPRNAMEVEFERMEINSSDALSSPRGPPSDSSLAEEDGLDSSMQDGLLPSIVCRRNPTDNCLVPQRVLYQLSAGVKGCSTLSFNPSGLLLAVACCGDSTDANSGHEQDFPIRIFDINSGVEMYVLKGHQGMVYSIEWLQDGSELLSASSDGTARIWSVGATAINKGALFRLHHLPPPAYVYCAVYHPVKLGIAFTGSYDGHVRVWNTRTGNLEGYLIGAGSGTNTVVPAHPAPVQCIRVESKAPFRVFTADAKGLISVWAPIPGGSDSPTAYDIIKMIRQPELIGRAITSMQFHPRKNHLLVQGQNNRLFQFELRSYLLLNKGYTGVKCEKYMVKSSFSPDGRFVVSGSEDGSNFIFSSLNGQGLQEGIWGSKMFDTPLVEISWSPTAHITALAAYGGNNPVIVLCASRDDEDSAITVSALGGEVSEEQATIAQPVSTDERVQRALERRRQRLHAKLALEAELSSKSPGKLDSTSRTPSTDFK